MSRWPEFHLKLIAAAAAGLADPVAVVDAQRRELLRRITMRDGAFVDETRLAGGTTGSLAGLEPEGSR